jgi:alpha-L-rhamnosidase
VETSEERPTLSGTHVGPVRFEHRQDALGLGTGTPRLSWQIASDAPDFRLAASELELTHAGGQRELARVETADQVLVPWPFPPLPSRAQATVRVRVSDGAGWSGWSEPSPLEVGLLSPEDWSAGFVSPRGIGGIGEAAPVLRRVVHIDAPVERARLYITAHGVYRASIDGRPVGDQVLAPGWTSYDHRLRYEAYDVSEMLRPGDNVLEVVLGNGWFRGRLGFAGERAHYGDRLALLAQLELTGADGREERIVTDGSWTAHPSQVVADDLYDGQRTDLRRPVAGGAPADVEVIDADLGRLVTRSGPPMRVVEVLPAVEIVASDLETGEVVVDFGQNVVGWVRLRLQDTTAGHEVRVRHAEVVEDGRLALRPLRSAEATDTYVLAGGPEEVLEPCFTLHGFRYAGITGPRRADGPVDIDLDVADVEAVVVASDLERTGWFTSSDPQLDQLHENVVWSMRGNFVDVPTDCPQRDERLGWTGDLQVFAPTACFLFGTAGLLSSWLADLAAEQRPDGSLPMVVPDVLGLDPSDAVVAGWGDASAIVPWVAYERYADRELLERQFDCMRRWVDRARSRTAADGTWSGGFQLGDWLDPAAPPEEPWAARADPAVVATAYLVRSAELVARTAAVLGDDGAAAHYASLAEATRAAFAREFVTAGGRVLSDCPTVYALALVWDLLPDPNQRVAAGRRLADLVRTSGFHVSTGFLGTPLVADALCATGQAALAYRMLFETGCPSWLYPVTMGATTVWERWDSLLPDGSVNPGGMTSFNHYAFGAVADWLHRTVAGLAPAAPGYRRVTVRPVPGAMLSAASARHLSPYGEVAVGWQRHDGRFELDVRIPVGVTAEVHLPGADEEEPIVVDHGRHRWATADPVPAHGAPPAGATLRDLFDDPHLFGELADLLVRSGLGPTRADVARQLLPQLDQPVDALPVPLTVGALMAGALGLAPEIAALVKDEGS